MKTLSLFCLVFFTVSISFCQNSNALEAIRSQMRIDATDNMIDKWYPLVLDYEHGGYFSEITYDFKLGEMHNKMIVTQARHIWTCSLTAEFFSDRDDYLNYAAHGFKFLKEVMWDQKFGGFYNLVSKEGKPIAKKGEEKTAYGNSFALYGLAAYYRVSKDEQALELAKKTFLWLEEHSHDPINKGYYQSLNRDGSPILRDSTFDSTSEIGYKDQNSSIHLLEAFTELYKVWPEKLVAERLEELLLLIRNTIVNDRNYMNLFFEPDWTPVTFNEETKDIIKKHYYLDHVSFGHDVEIAYLMLEASEILKRKDTEETLLKGKMMVDHAIENGWDKAFGGFYDGGYYFGADQSLTIVNSDKNWWSQAEGLNTLLIMQHHFPNDSHNYGVYFIHLWEYVNTFFMDDRYGGWYEWGQDSKPETKNNLKGHVWKANYHNFRALINCLKLLEE